MTSADERQCGPRGNVIVPWPSGAFGGKHQIDLGPFTPLVPNSKHVNFGGTADDQRLLKILYTDGKIKLTDRCGTTWLGTRKIAKDRMK